MADLIKFSSFSDARGDLYAIDDALPFFVKRVYYVTNSDLIRGGHRHIRCRQLLFCVHGEIEVTIETFSSVNRFLLINDGVGLLVEPQDWHTFKCSTKNDVLVVLASEKYDAEDYVYDKI